jgi:hypothetical protein
VREREKGERWCSNEMEPWFLFFRLLLVVLCYLLWAWTLRGGRNLVRKGKGEERERAVDLKEIRRQLTEY